MNKGKWTEEKIIGYIEDNGYKFIKFIEFNKVLSTIEIECNHGHIYTVKFRKFLEGRRCVTCFRKIKAKNQTLTYEKVKENIESEGYELLSKEYIDNRTNKLKIKCDKGHEYETIYSNFQQGQRCPYCNESKGEKEIERILNKYNIEYFYNKPYFKDLIGVGEGLLRPDFIIEDRRVWIEYDGEQHFEPIDFANKGKEWAEKNHIKQVENDKIKNDYANKNNWILIRIPYWEKDNIEKIIVNKLKLE